MFPWSKNENLNEYINKLVNIKPDEIEEYTKKIIQESVPNSNFFNSEQNNKATKKTVRSKENVYKNEDNHNSEDLKVKVFESHEDVFVQFTIKNKNDLNVGKIFYNSNQLFLQDVPNIGDKHNVVLPAIVQQRGAKVLYKNGILQIKIPKAEDTQFTEVDLDFLK